ncbi:MAG: alpha-L-rhamnosidase C-terminal domain-containing protein [Bacteroidales bacterium]|nr:alpha-L-rhamnosidase C-terminal domain-containing protein [Bacteroidales bacterium]
MKRLFLSLCLLLTMLTAVAQFPPLTEGWISVPDSDPNGYGVYYFRKDISVTQLGQPYLIRVSGDNRFKLYVNKKLATLGPTRGDVAHWNYERVDLAPFLHSGRNVVAAVVWNDGPYKPEANISYRTGFLIQPESEVAKNLTTDASWICTTDKGYRPFPVRATGYYAAGPGEIVDFRKNVSDWMASDADLSQWKKAQIIVPVQRVGTNEGWGTYPGWMLQQSPLPQRDLKEERLKAVRSITGAKPAKAFLQGQAPLIIAPHGQMTCILDNGQLTNAYFHMLIAKGRDARISIGYAEALYDKDMRKGNRDDIEGKHFVGRKDSLIANGSDHQEFTSLEWRTYRYVVLNVETADEPLVIDDLYGIYTGFPFELKASIGNCPDELQRIFDIGWHTAQLCAIETYMDCPYYEQLQYFGDARIQALISYYMTGDDRLARNMLRMADLSRGAEGVTQSRYPSQLAQWIQPYALHHIYSMHDYMMMGSDSLFIKSLLMGERTILNYFGQYLSEDGRVKGLPGWNFTDWVDNRSNWERGIALPGQDGCNAVMDLQLLYAYQMAADLEEHLGMKAYAELYREKVDHLKTAILKNYWRAAVGLLSDRSDKEVYSQHANALGILTGVIDNKEARTVAEKILSDTTLAQASIYFRFYVHRALVCAGLGDDYLSWLGKWREYLSLGMTTWGEISDVEGTRSDCHAWSASPNIELMRTVLGIESDQPFFSHVRVNPHLGNLKAISGSMPSPQGIISVSYKKKGSRLSADITLPDKLSGDFVWGGKTIRLHPGTQYLEIEMK